MLSCFEETHAVAHMCSAKCAPINPARYFPYHFQVQSNQERLYRKLACWLCARHFHPCHYKSRMLAQSLHKILHRRGCVAENQDHKSTSIISNFNLHAAHAIFSNQFSIFHVFPYIIVYGGGGGVVCTLYTVSTTHNIVSALCYPINILSHYN